MMKKAMLKSGIILLALMMIMGCGGGSSGGASPGGSGGGSSQQPAEKLKIGYVGGLSGTTAAFGIPILEAVEFAIAEMNMSGGIKGHRLELVQVDDEGNPFKGQQAIDKFASEGVRFVISGSSSAVALSEVPKVKEKNIVAISPVASDPAIPREDTNFFVNTPNNTALSHAIAEYAGKVLGVKEVIAFIRDDAYGKSIFEGFKEKAASVGIQIVAEYSYPVNSNDFNSYISKGLSEYPNAHILLTGYAADGGLIAKQARSLGYDKPFLATNPMTNDQYRDVASSASDDTYISAIYFPRDPADMSEKTNSFIGAWKKEKGMNPNVYQVMGYEAAYLLKETIETADSMEPGDVKKQLASIKDYEGVSGKMVFHPNGSVTKPVYIVHLNDGIYKLDRVMDIGTF